jgi:hypothetical protein
MLAADIAKISLAEIKNYPAKTFFVKVRASIALAKPKMRAFALLDAVQNLDCIRVLACTVFAKRGFVYIYFPADTAGMGAFIGNTFKISVIFRGVKLHNFHLLLHFNTKPRFSQ